MLAEAEGDEARGAEADVDREGAGDWGWACFLAIVKE